ncbi:MAG: hypothetical protein IT529_15365 [Burkholderiales bacterium]|nr:hypothetical protein [Burkholderiales bacterium]
METRSEKAIDDPGSPVLVEPDADGNFSEFATANAVARLLLSRIQHRLPQWAAVRPDGTVLLARRGRTAHERQVDLLPQLLFEINWGDSGPGYSWPESYHVAWVPGFSRYVVTASADSTDAYGYEDIAIGWFEEGEGRIEGAKRVIGDWWRGYRDRDHEGWVDLLGTGLIDEAGVRALREQIWSHTDEAELDRQYEEEQERLAPYKAQIDVLIGQLTANWPKPGSYAASVAQGMKRTRLRDAIERFVLENGRLPDPGECALE